MTFQAGAWVAGSLGALAGVAATRLSATPLGGSRVGGRVMGALVGVVLAVLAYGVLSLLEGWAAWFRRTASPLVPLLFTTMMHARGLGDRTVIGPSPEAAIST